MIIAFWLMIIAAAFVLGVFIGRWLFKKNCHADCGHVHQKSATIDGLQLDVMQSQLAEAKALAASQAKSVFLTNISHEIRTPIHAVLGQLQLLEQTSLSNDQFQYLHQARQSSRVLLDLLGNLLDYSRIEAGRLSLENTSIDLHDTVDRLRLSLFAMAVNKGLSLTVGIDPLVPRYVKGDSLRLTQVLMNLVGNAIKFTPAGKVEILLSASAGGEPVEVLFEVVDTGVGIAPEALTRIFEDFSQAESGTTRKFGGSGLGLAIASKLVQMMGGKLSVDSEKGVGTRFYFSIPFEAGKEHEIVQPVDMAARFDIDLNDCCALKGMKILLTEDDPSVQEMTLLLLEQQGAMVEQAFNGVQAVELMNSGKVFDVILMDLQMPDMDGNEATRIIRKVQPSIPIIAMTANVLEEDRQRAFAAGMSDFLIKPIDIRELVQTLRHHGLSEFKTTEADPATRTKVENVRLEDIASPAGFDLQPALQRMNNQPKIYLATAKRFIDTIEEVRSDLVGALDQGDFAFASRLFHRIKGSALMLGATELGEYARDIREIIENGEKLQSPDKVAEKLTELVNISTDNLKLISSQLRQLQNG